VVSKLTRGERFERYYWMTVMGVVMVCNTLLAGRMSALFVGWSAASAIATVELLDWLDNRTHP
jgi:hypothetical protein